MGGGRGLRAPASSSFFSLPAAAEWVPGPRSAPAPGRALWRRRCLALRVCLPDETLERTLRVTAPTTGHNGERGRCPRNLHLVVPAPDPSPRPSTPGKPRGRPPKPPNTTECPDRMKPSSELPSREPGACGGGAGSRGREGVGSSGGWELVAPSGRPPPRISAPEPHHGARKGELFGRRRGLPGWFGSASLRRGKAGGEASGNSLGGRGRVLGAGRDPETLSGGAFLAPARIFPLFPHRQ